MLQSSYRRVARPAPRGVAWVSSRLRRAFVYLLFFSASTSTVAAADRPNLLFIMTDDHAYQAVSAYGSALIQTPNIDRIAQAGMRFDRCYVTNSICGPSRACILTGKYSHKNGMYKNNDPFDTGQVTFPALLQDAGYQTALVGKWHLGDRPTGFDYWNIVKHQGYYYQPKFLTKHGESQHVGYVTDLVTRYTLDWLKNDRRTDQPFLLLMHHKAPHRPWDPGPSHMTTFDTATKFPEPPTLFDDYSHRASAARQATMQIDADLATEGPDLKAWDRGGENGHRDWFYNKMTLEQHRDWLSAFHAKNAAYYENKSLTGKALVRWKYQRFLQDYLACVAGVDDSIGEVLDYLDESGLANNTVVVYCSDQGFFLGEHGWFDKRFMYEEALRTPLVVRWPGEIAAGSVDGHIVSNLDFAQTFIELAGAEPDPAMQGRSLVPLLRGKSVPNWRDSFYYHYYEGGSGGHNVCEHYGVTDGRYKLIHFYKLDEWELFDLREDPHEMRSVYAKPEYAEIRQAMKAELARLRNELEVEQTE